jgi:hypothetical protein
MRNLVVRPFVLVLVLAACGSTPRSPRSGGSGAATAAGSGATTDKETRMMERAGRLGSTAEDQFGPLDVGADYATYRKLTKQPFQSLDHGNRWVDVYVNEIGADAYLRGTDIPVGTTIVKPSWEDDHGRPSTIAGPFYVMQKRAKGYAPDHGDWYFAIQWAKPTPTALKKFGGAIYWRGKSPKIQFCSDCHDSYDRELGGLVPSSDLPR